MTQWLARDTAPRDGNDFLGCMWGTSIIVVCYDDDPEQPGFPWLTLDGPSYAEEALTHWMPLPELPKTHNTDPR